MAVINYSPRPLNRTELVKTIYLIDCEHAKLYGTTLTGITYLRDNFGPFSWDIPNTLDELSEDGLISIKVAHNMFGSPMFLHETQIPYDITKEVAATSYLGVPDEFYSQGSLEGIYDNLDKEEVKLVFYIIKRIKNLSLRRILRLAYSTEPMRNILREERLLNKKLYGRVIEMDACRPSIEKRPLKALKLAYKKIDFSQRGTDEEYAEIIKEEFKELECFRKRIAEQ